ncbi:MAG: thiamine-phosphate kinase [Aigarchaeota archaeon]|nr:thiamine-phosphate kinase [Aigarchaeota archaeon]
MKLSDVGEKKLVEYILSRIGIPEGLVLGTGDDAVAFNFHGTLVASVDMLVASTDVPPGMSMKQAGKKAVTMNVSDLASKGATPKFFLISLGLPADMPLEDFRQLWEGLEEASRFYGGRIAGGDTNACRDIVVDCIGLGQSDKPLSRSGAKPGDILAVTGRFGRTAAGLRMLLENMEDPLKPELVQAALEPRARLQEGMALARSGAATACIDSSDGLAISLHELSALSHVGFHVSSPPVDELSRDFAQRNRLPLMDLVFHGGEEYELVATVTPDLWEAARRAVNFVGGELTPVGRATEPQEGIKVIWQETLVSLPRRGWNHFSRKGKSPLIG